MSIRDWINKHRNIIRKNGGMQEKLNVIEKNTEITDKILGKLNKRVVDRRLLPDRRETQET